MERQRTEIINSNLPLTFMLLSSEIVKGLIHADDLRSLHSVSRAFITGG